MVEIRQKCQYTLEDFLTEFNNGNFENGERKLPYKQFLLELKKERKNNND